MSRCGTPLLYLCILKETYKMQEYGKRNHFTHGTEKGMGRSAGIHPSQRMFQS